MSDLKLEVGKAYVFIDGDARDGYLEKHNRNKDIFGRHYNDGYAIGFLDEDGCGFVGGDCVISEREIKYFKLKETKMKATDIVNVEMTALDAVRLRALIGNTAYAHDLYNSLLLKGISTGHEDAEFNFKDSGNWSKDSKLTKWALSQFEPEKTEQQIKIEKLRKTIDDAKAQIDELEG